MIILLKEVVSKFSKSLQSMTLESLVQVTKFVCAEVLCAVSGNDSIAFLVALLKRSQ